MRSNLSVIFGILFIVGCATALYTGRNQFILVSEGQEASLGDEAGLAVVMATKSLMRWRAIRRSA